MQREELINNLISNVISESATSQVLYDMASKAYDMGKEYVETRKFNNSKYFHNYNFSLDDGTSVSSSSYYNLFMCRTQTHAYLEAETAVKATYEVDEDKLFHLVRDKRNGINGVFKAIMSPMEPQQLNNIDFVLIIAAFCLGALDK